MEAIAAIVMLTIAIPPIVWALRQGHVDRIDPVLASRARWLAVEKIEDVIADRHSTTRGYAYLVAGNYPAEGAITGYPGFSRAVTLNETTVDLSTPGAGYMNVTITVSWTDGKGVARSLAIATVLTEHS